jgi:hypothetical protein
MDDRRDRRRLRYFSSLLPLWEKVAKGGLRPPFKDADALHRLSRRMRGLFLSMDRSPSPVRDASRRVHPLPQGERGKSAPMDNEFPVMPGLDPGIHVFLADANTNKTWMAGINPAMTQ